MRRIIRPEDVTAGGDYAGCDLSGVDLKGRDLRGADFDGANLSFADLSRCSLHLATFRGAYLIGTKLSEAKGAINFDRTIMENAVLESVDFADSRFVSANMKRIQAKGANLRRSDLFEADLSDADLSFASLQSLDGLPVLLRANLFKTDLPGSIHTGPWIAGATILKPKEIPAPKTHKARSISRHTVYQAYKILHWFLFANRQNNENHPVGRFLTGREWQPNENIEGYSASKTKAPGDKTPLSYYERCRSQAHCRELIIRGLDLDLNDPNAATTIPPDVLLLIRDQSIPLLREHLQCGEDLAMSIMLVLITKSMREGFKI